MNIRIYSIVLFLSLIFFGGACVNKQKQSSTKEFPEDFIKTLTHKDTVAMIGLTTVCMDTLQAGKIDDALNLIYCVRNDTLVPLSNETKAELKRQFERFPVKQYHLESFQINGYSTNSVKYVVQFKEKSTLPNTIKLTFNPIWIEDAWYLTLKNN